MQLLTKGLATLHPQKTVLTVRVHNRTMLHADETKPRRANNNDHNTPKKHFNKCNFKSVETRDHKNLFER